MNWHDESCVDFQEKWISFALAGLNVLSWYDSISREGFLRMNMKLMLDHCPMDHLTTQPNRKDQKAFVQALV